MTRSSRRYDSAGCRGSLAPATGATTARDLLRALGALPRAMLDAPVVLVVLGADLTSVRGDCGAIQTSTGPSTGARVVLSAYARP